MKNLFKILFTNPLKKIFFVLKITDFEIFDLLNKQILVEVFPISPII